MRSKKAFLNISISILLQLTTIVCGLIVPKLIIQTYGSSTNGLIASITQFLSYVVLLEAGVGGVIRFALYKFLAFKENKAISRVIKASEDFFRKIAIIYVGYLFVVVLIYPKIVISDFSNLFTISLILIIGISTFFQYYFGISAQLLLQADQKQFITSLIQLISLIINTLMIIFLINSGYNIMIVKLSSSLIFIIRPILINYYVRRKYNIDRSVLPDNDSIKQRWDGFGHHLAFFVTNSTDIVVLTLFTTIKEVSVYSIYMMVISSVQLFVVTFFSGLEATFGNIIANKDTPSLKRNFQIVEFLSYFLTTIFFTCTYFLILPFIGIYTSGIVDVSYYRPEFASIMILVSVVYCIRLPFNSVILASGHYKQTRNGAFIEAVINISISLLLVNYYGLVGVAIGTLCAMIFRTSQIVAYLSHHILSRSILVFIFRISVFILDFILVMILIRFIPKFEFTSFEYWLIYAFDVAIISVLTTLTVSLTFFKNEIVGLFTIVMRVFKNER